MSEAVYQWVCNQHEDFGIRNSLSSDIRRRKVGNCSEGKIIITRVEVKGVHCRRKVVVRSLYHEIYLDLPPRNQRFDLRDVLIQDG